MPEDVAIASTKSEVDTCTDDRDIDRPKSADRQTAFQLYIVDTRERSVVTVLFF